MPAYLVVPDIPWCRCVGNITQSQGPLLWRLLPCWKTTFTQVSATSPSTTVRVTSLPTRRSTTWILRIWKAFRLTLLLTHRQKPHWVTAETMGPIWAWGATMTNTYRTLIWTEARRMGEYCPCQGQALRNISSTSYFFIIYMYWARSISGLNYGCHSLPHKEKDLAFVKKEIIFLPSGWLYKWIKLWRDKEKLTHIL